MIDVLFNHQNTLLFAGGLFAWILAASIDSIKNIKRIAKVKSSETPDPKDITSDNSTEKILPNIRQTLVNTGIQPLLIITFINLTDNPNELNIIGVFVLVIFVMFHEFYLSEKHSTKLFYQLIILSIWILYYLSMGYRLNM